MHRNPVWNMSLGARPLALVALLLLAWPPEALSRTGPPPEQEQPPPNGQEEEHDPEEELRRVLGLTPEEIEAMGLSDEEAELLLHGFAEETVVVGSRAEPRSATSSAVPVDVLSSADLIRPGAGDLKERLRAVIPSFNVNTQPVGAASTVVRPAMLRNLAPDHTLVLINGKRRHRSSVVDWHGGNGVAFGSQGPDISTIPGIAVRQVEVLRDGAAAQYGSDAIAGVMNFELKDASSGGSFWVNSGAFREGDGEALEIAANVGLPLGQTGFANLSGEYGQSNPTSRSSPRNDAIALRGAGNSHVVSDTPQRWGAAEVDDDLKVFGNFGYDLAAGIHVYAHAGHARKTVTQGFFFRNPNTRLGVYSNTGGRTLLIGDALQAAGAGSAGCPAVTVTDHVPDPAALQRVLDDPDCFTFQEVYPGGFTPKMGGTARDTSAVAGIRGLRDSGFQWDLSASSGAHQTELFIRETVNASLGPLSPTEFDTGVVHQREIGLNADVSYPLTRAISLAAGAEWREERFEVTQGEPASWEVGPYGRQGFTAGANGFPGYGPLNAGAWSRSNVAVYGDAEATGAEDRWTAGAALRFENFEDFGATLSGKLAARIGFLRGAVNTGFRAPTPGQQNGSNISSWFDPTLGDLINNAVIPSISPVAALRGGVPLEPERSVSGTVGVVLDQGPFSLTADFFRIDVRDRIGITSNFLLTDGEVAQLEAGGIEAARDLRNFRFFTNAFSTSSQGVDVVATWIPLALRGNTVFSAVFNFTDTDVTDNARGLLDDRRLTEYRYALPRVRWNAAVTQRFGLLQVLARLSYYGGWYDYDSGYAKVFDPSGGLEQGFFEGKPILDIEATVDLGRGFVLAAGAQNALNTYSQETARAMSVGEKYSEYTPWGYSGGYYFARLGWSWGA